MMDPDNELYDASCDVFAAAQRLSRAATGDGVQPAVPATLGCISASLGALTVGCAALGRSAGPVEQSTFDQLIHALRRAQSACEAARSSTTSGHATSASRGAACRGT